MQEFTERIRDALARHAGIPAKEVKIESPRDPALGDLAFPCFPLAKRLRKAPPAIAAELAEALAAELEDVSVEATGPYLNFRIRRNVLAASVLGSIEEAGEHYGGGDEGRGRTVVLDYSSPNIAKQFHVGHLRSTIIGAALMRVYEALGYRPVGINHIGDWGSQFGKLVAGIQREGIAFEDLEFTILPGLYVRSNELAESDPAFADAARAAFRELEEGGENEVRRLWRHLTEISLAEFDKVYQRLGVAFDHVRGEAFYEPFLDPTVERIVAAGVTEESDGALIIRLDHLEKGMAPCLLRKSDGTTLYATRDLAALFHRWDELAFDRCLYVVGSDQRLHFRQLKTVLRRLELEWEPRVQHVDFGMMSLPEGKMQARKGRVVLLEDLLDRAVEEARRIISEKNPDLADADRIAEEVGIGAVVFNDLKKERVKDIVFEWDQVLSFEGETGPYVQYTHARLCSILRKAEPLGLSPTAPGDLAGLDGALVEDAAGILLACARFPAVVRSAAAHAEPSEISQYLLELCRDLNSWYVRHKVLGDDPGQSAVRLALVRGAKIVIGNGLRLLGLAAPAEM